jgi:hypothetical protein
MIMVITDRRTACDPVYRRNDDDAGAAARDGGRAETTDGDH